MLHTRHQREELDIELEGKKLTQGNSFVYMGGAVRGDGKTEREREREKEVHRRAQAGANAWKAVEGVTADRRISKRLKGKVVSTCVTPACLYRTETLAMTELQQKRLQVCESNWLKKIARVTRAYVQEKNGGVKGRDGSAEELDRETGEEQTTVDRTRWKDGG